MSKGKLFDISHIEEENQKKEFNDLSREIILLKQLLINQIEKENENKMPVDKRQVTIACQLLILHYLGIIQQIDIPNTKKAVLLSFILGAEGNENIRQGLSDIRGKKTYDNQIKDLEFVRELFEKVGLTEPLKKVEKDLQKLHSKPQ